MPGEIELSVIIPTHGRPAKVAACVGALARQAGAPGCEVLVGCDGPDPAAEAAAGAAWGEHGGRAERMRVVHCRKQGQAGVRNELLPLARGRTLVFLNDDMVPGPGHLAAHARAQAQAANAPALVIGACPWRVPARDSLFSRLVRETSMVFFFDVMEQETDAARDWGFRHAWLLNLSAPAALVREVGGFTVFPSTYGYEDDELAYRLHQRFGTRVLYCPAARADHDHPITPDEYLAREYKLGYAAHGFARTTPACAGALFGRDVLSPGEIDYCRAFTARELAQARRLHPEFLRLGEAEPEVIDGPSGAMLRRVLYQWHLPLKRWCWRAGLLDAAQGREMQPEAALSRLCERPNYT